MDVQIGEINSTVRAVDSETLLTPQMMNEIIRTILQALEANDLHQKRVRSEQQITGGVRQELEGDL